MGHEQAGVAQHIEQGVAPHLDARLLQGLAQHVMQLACTHAGLTHTLLPHQLHYGLCTLHAMRVSLTPLVVRLPAHAHVLAGPADAQSLHEPLLKDLPEGFFTTRTP